MQDGCRAGKEDPAEGIPFVRMGRFWEGKWRVPAAPRGAVPC